MRYKALKVFQFYYVFTIIASNAFPFEKMHVDIVNGFQGNLLQIHCQSKDDDLGDQELVPGQVYGWGFRINFLATTLYYCTFWWKNGHHENDVFWSEQKHLRGCCGSANCVWKASEDGIYLYNDGTKTFEFMYAWDKSY
ncbi:hypothetical protein HS088_TW18G00116 [Tripterygium wilfordii]|uniref:S-protein homolog n=1 Tax=Tripterygium wilfordii TaxID=458696 RepID=A0A7J7CBE2_TRIWF|nr:hypothetical protein HS088_TW18G00116 [Tripterygium wilfordii]